MSHFDAVVPASAQAAFTPRGVRQIVIAGGSLRSLMGFRDSSLVTGQHPICAQMRFYSDLALLRALHIYVTCRAFDIGNIWVHRFGKGQD